MRATKFYCKIFLDGVEEDKTIYEDIDGDWFIYHSDRYFDFELFTAKHPYRSLHCST
jgi:hypothetical protein